MSAELSTNAATGPTEVARVRHVSPADLPPTMSAVTRGSFVVAPTVHPDDVISVIVDTPGPRGETLVACRIVTASEATLLDEQLFCSHDSASAIADAYGHVERFAESHDVHAALFISDTTAHKRFTATPHWHLSAATRSDRRCDAALLDARSSLTTYARELHAASAPLRVATDASARRRHAGAGLAFVTEDGVCRQSYLDTVASVDGAELAAIEMALRTLKATKLEILTDSWAAYTSITKTHSLNGSVRRTLNRIQQLSAGREVGVRWTKGHAGNPLNEAADRLARSARRNVDANVSPSVQQQIQDSIVADLLAA